MIDKDLNRQTHATWILILVGFLALSLVVLASVGKLSSEFTLGLGTLLTYAGNHTYQNYRTTPNKDK